MSTADPSQARAEPPSRAGVPLEEARFTVGPGLADVPRVLGRFGRAGSDPLLLCVASLHGNEPAGVLGVRRVLAALEEDPSQLRGRLVALSGNRQALARGQRYLVSDLNRIWLPERLGRRGSQATLEPDERELFELAAAIDEALSRVPGRPAFLLDLHTTSAPGPAFAVFDDTLPNRELALQFPVPLVLGLEEEIGGTLANHLSAQGVTSVGFEAGQHQDPMSVERAEAAVWIALEATGLLAPGARPEVAAARRLLAGEHAEYPRVMEVRHRHAVVPGDDFRMADGFVTFRPITVGSTLAWDRHGAVTAPMDGRILMPLYQAQGEDGFFVVREVRPFWLKTSAVLRRLRLERFLHLLPGVERHPDLPSSFVVDRRIARWVARQLFHLLGFRRQGPAERYLVMSRRDYDSTQRRRRRGNG